ncbi:MAG: Bug family tripartite tricarboxylate transporter substrate binding protein [Burkholderiales bacterium]
MGKIRCWTMATALFALYGIAPVFSQTFPTKPVRILSSGGPGGNNDTQTRGLAQFLGDRMGQPFVVENRTGAGGMIAAEACAKATPDGHTLCTFGVNAIIWNGVLSLKLPIDMGKELIGIAHTGVVDSILTAHPSLAANSLGELMALGKAKPGAIAWASFGLNSSGHYYTEWMRKFRGLNFLHVPYKTSILAQQAVIAGEVQVNSYGAGQALTMIKSGKVKALSVNSEKRLPELPEVQTETEAGVDLPLGTWFGMLAPTATPRETQLRLNTEINRVMTDAGFIDKFMTRLGFRGTSMSVDQFNAFLRKERNDFQKFADDMGLERK